MTNAMTCSSLQTFGARNPMLSQDLFHCILDSLVSPEESVYEFAEAHRVLASLARTCRAFSEPSLDRLWYKLDSIKPLILCYATVLDEETAKTPPSPSEWAIIHRYSHRIRELDVFLLDQFSLDFLRATSLYPSSLAPNLRLLKWNPSSYPPSRPSPSMVLSQRFLSPSLISLSVCLTDMDHATPLSFLANYPSLCPNLKSIHIYPSNYGNIPRRVIEVLSRAIVHQEYLERLDVAIPINEMALQHVVTSPKLKKISAVLQPDQSNLRQIHIPSDTIPFRNLEELFLEIWDLRFVTTLLRPEGQMFRSVEHCYHSRPTIGAVSSFFTALVSHCRTHSLQSIHLFPNRFEVESQIATSGEWDESPIHHHLTYDTFRPLASLRHLRRLIVDLVRWLSIDDDEFTSLIRNWPSLQVLSMSCQPHIQVYPWRWAKYVTFKGLLMLLEYCPDLRELSLPLDARVVPTDPRNVICNPSLTCISFPSSPINDVHLVQDILARHFPSVIDVSPPFHPSSQEDDDEIDQYIDSWATVNEHLQSIHYPDQDNPLSYVYIRS